MARNPIRGRSITTCRSYGTPVRCRRRVREGASVCVNAPVEFAVPPVQPRPEHGRASVILLASSERGCKTSLLLLGGRTHMQPVPVDFIGGQHVGRARSHTMTTPEIRVTGLYASHFQDSGPGQHSDRSVAIRLLLSRIDSSFQQALSVNSRLSKRTL